MKRILAIAALATFAGTAPAQKMSPPISPPPLPAPVPTPIPPVGIAPRKPLQKPLTLIGHTLGEPEETARATKKSMHEANCARAFPQSHSIVGYHRCLENELPEYDLWFGDGQLVKFERDFEGGNAGVLGNVVYELGMPPTKQTYIAHRKRFGEKWEDRLSEWDLPNGYVSVYEDYNPAGNGRATITMETKELRAKEEKKVSGNSRD
jgi:hypothetical protein